MAQIIDGSREKYGTPLDQANRQLSKLYDLNVKNDFHVLIERGQELDRAFDREVIDRLRAHHITRQDYLFKGDVLGDSPETRAGSRVPACMRPRR